MAIKNTLFGGTDWNDAEVLETVDVNDTFDAAYNKIIEKTTFWNDSEWFTVYDSFAASVAAGKWDISGTVAWSNTSNAGGDASGEAKLTQVAGTISSSHIISNALPQNKNAYHFKGRVLTVAGNTGGNLHYILSFRERDGTNTTMWNDGQQNTNVSKNFYFSILVLKTAADTYDVYMGGKMIVTISDADLEIGLRISNSQTSANNGSATIFMDDVRYTNE